LESSACIAGWSKWINAVAICVRYEHFQTIIVAKALTITPEPKYFAKLLVKTHI
jgi:hypothetical protein